MSLFTQTLDRAIRKCITQDAGLYVIMKNGKYVEDYSDGKKLTSSWNKAEKYSSANAALEAAKRYGSGYKPVTLKSEQDSKPRRFPSKNG